MINLAIALVILFGLYQAIRFAGSAPPKALVRAAKTAAGLVCFAAAGLVFLRGHTEIAIGLAGLGFWLAGWGASPKWLERLRGGGRTSVLRSAMIEIEFDPASGAVGGTVLAGSFEGRRLNDMTPAELDALYKSCAANDPAGAHHLEVYFDRRFPGWRQTGQGDANARGGNNRVKSAGAMTEDEAYEVLGLHKGAARDEITRAHRTLMKKLHPDQGGTTALAARVNEAKEILMRRHQ